MPQIPNKKDGGLLLRETEFMGSITRHAKFQIGERTFQEDRNTFMANHNSAIKKMRQDEKRRIRNKSYKTRVKNVVKEVEEALKDQNREAAEQAFQNAVSVLDRVASKGIIHKNKAARKKSRLAKRIHAL